MRFEKEEGTRIFFSIEKEDLVKFGEAMIKLQTQAILDSDETDPAFKSLIKYISGMKSNK